MNKENIWEMVDYTLLKQTATWEDVKNLCNEGIKNNVASICIPQYFVKKAKEYVQNKIKICTVVGFPNGYSYTSSKIEETKQAIIDGADEIDMVININALKEKQYEYILDEINGIKDACQGRILKVIIETCLLTKEEKIKMCEIISNSGADFIKTSTGFSNEGAKLEDIKLFKKYLSINKKIKAAGGIRSFEVAEQMIEAGVTRIGASRLED